MFKKSVVVALVAVLAAQAIPAVSLAAYGYGGGGGGGGGGGIPSLFGQVNTNPYGLANPPQLPQGQVLGASAFNFTRSLFLGMSGEDVTELQKMLKQMGYFNGEATGYFGPLTFAAVKKFQAAHGLEQVGHVGPMTRGILNRGSTNGTTTPALTDAQRQTLILQIQTKIAELLAKIQSLQGR